MRPTHLILASSVGVGFGGEYHLAARVTNFLKFVCLHIQPSRSSTSYGRLSGVSYVIENTVSPNQRRNAGLSLNCLKSSVASFITPTITLANALSCSKRAFCLSEFFFAF